MVPIHNTKSQGILQVISIQSYIIFNIFYFINMPL